MQSQIPATATDAFDPWTAPSRAIGIIVRFHEGVYQPASSLLEEHGRQKSLRERKFERELREEKERQTELESDLDKLIKLQRTAIASSFSDAVSHLKSQNIAYSLPPQHLPYTPSTDSDQSAFLTKMRDKHNLDATLHDAAAKALGKIESLESFLKHSLRSIRRPDHPFAVAGGANVFIIAMLVGAIAGFSNKGMEAFAAAIAVFYLILIILSIIYYNIQSRSLSKLWSKFIHLKADAESELDVVKIISEKDFMCALNMVRSSHSLLRQQSLIEEQQLTTEMAAKLRPIMEAICEEAASLDGSSGWATLAWSSPKWESWQPAKQASFAASYGTHCFLPSENFNSAFPQVRWKLELPAYFPFDSQRGILIKTSGSSMAKVAQAIEGFVLRLLTVIPPGKARLTFIDPVGLGNNVAGLMSLADYDDMLINSRAWSEPQHIEKRLEELTEHMGDVIQKYLQNTYKTIHEYNDQAGEVAEPHRFVVVYDFATNFTETAARRLISIAQNGPRCGVYPIVIMDTEKPLPYGFSIEALESQVQVIQDGKLGLAMEQLAKAGLNQWKVEFPTATASSEVTEAVKKKIGELSKQNSRVEVPYQRSLQLAGIDGDNNWEQFTTIRNIEIPLGPEGATKARSLVLGEGMAHHGLIVGRIGSGKSNLLHVIISTLALKYSPQEIELYLIDFKQGVEFVPYATNLLPHARAIAVESDREFALSVLERLEDELEARGKQFRNEASNITEYREGVSHPVLPRIVLIVDEFQEFFRDDDPLSKRASSILNHLVLQGRSWGMHVLLSTQSLSNVRELSRGTFDQMAIRIALQCSEADSRLILADDNPAARLLSRPGEAIYNDKAGLIEGNQRFQVARLDSDSRDAMLVSVNQKAAALAAAAGTSPNRPVVFNGHQLVDINESEIWRSHARDTRPLSHQDRQMPVVLWLGEPVAIRPTLTAKLSPQAGNNLLIVARDEEEGAGMALTALVGACLQTPPSTMRIVIADFTTRDAKWSRHCSMIKDLFPHEIQVLSTQRELAPVLRELAGELKRREQGAATGNSLPDIPQETTLVFFLGLQRMKILREDDDSMPYSGIDQLPHEFFETLIRDGPELGMHTIIWCDSLNSVNRCIDRKALSQFGYRCATAMSENDSIEILDDVAAGRVDRPYRAFFYDEYKPGTIDKFIPFAIPSMEWLSQVSEVIKRRNSTL